MAVIPNGFQSGCNMPVGNRVEQRDVSDIDRHILRRVPIQLRRRSGVARRPPVCMPARFEFHIQPSRYLGQVAHSRHAADQTDAGLCGKRRIIRSSPGNNRQKCEEERKGADNITRHVQPDHRRS